LFHNQLKQNIMTENFEIKLSTKGAGGTHLFTEISTNYENLVNVLGEPNIDGDGYKTDAEWLIEINGKVLTIYNWKDGKNYCGDDGLELDEITDWHIGAKDDVSEEVEYLKLMLRD
jgi:hypothetical protein